MDSRAQRQSHRRPQPREHGRAGRHVPGIERGGRQSGDRRREARLQGLAAHACAQARRNSLPRRRNSYPAQRRFRDRHDARNGQSARRNARRRAGSHRHDLLDGRRRPPPIRPDHSVRAAQQICNVRALANRRRGTDHAVEFPDGDSVVESDSRARLRQHGGHQAGRRHAAFHLQPDASAHRSRPAARRDERRVRRRPRRGRADPQLIRTSTSSASPVPPKWAAS